MKIAILKNWPHENISRQMPASPTGNLAKVEFQFDTVEGADFVVVLNGVSANTVVECDPGRLWAIIMEPPSPYHRYMHRGQKAFARIYTTDTRYRDQQHRPSIGALAWHVDKTFDELEAERYPAKTGQLSWITSNLNWLPGHKVRMNFLDRIRATDLPLDLFGRGFTPIADKWDGLAPYRYSIGFENFSGGYYWTEKLVDCFLSFTTPFYYGSPEVGKFFPAGSYIAIDPDDPKVFDRMHDYILGDFHEANRSALEEARHLCMTKYSTVEFIASEVLAYNERPRPPRRIALRSLREPRPSLLSRVGRRIVNAIRVPA